MQCITTAIPYDLISADNLFHDYFHRRWQSSAYAVRTNGGYARYIEALVACKAAERFALTLRESVAV